MKYGLWILIGFFGVSLAVIGKFYFWSKGLSTESPQLTVAGPETWFALVMWSLIPIGIVTVSISCAFLFEAWLEHGVGRAVRRLRKKN